MKVRKISLFVMIKKVKDDPAIPAIIVFLCISLIVVVFTGLKITLFHSKGWGFYDQSFWVNFLVEAHGMLLDLFVIGILLFWLDKRREQRQEVQKYKNEIDDFRNWHEEEAKCRIIGNIKRLVKVGVSRINLRECHLKGVDLQDINLSGSDFSFTKLDNATINSSRFENCVFYCTSLEGAHIIDANLKNAIISGIKLKDTLLDSVDLRNAMFFNVDFVDVDLSNSQLDGVQYDSRTRFQKDFTLEERNKRGMKLNENLLEATKRRMREIRNQI